jgi:HPt (histidine-containing phosphotransfer) domain-containing protein
MTNINYMSTTQEPAFDWAQASSLLGDDPNAVEPDMAAIVRELVEGAEVQFQALKGLDPETSRKEISSQAHALRGCLLNFGFSEVGGILLGVEKGPFPSGEYLDRINQAEAAFVASKKMLAARYPSVGMA